MKKTEENIDKKTFIFTFSIFFESATTLLTGALYTDITIFYSF